MLLPRARLIVPLALLVALLAVPAARAYGDPASAVLGDPDSNLFLPYSTKTPPAARTELKAAVAAATKRGFPVRVAVLASPYDMGSLTALWRKPKQYAKLLATEIAGEVSGPLVVVMPDGIGFAYPKHPTARAHAALEAIAVRRDPGGLARTATSVVDRLAALYTSGRASPQQTGSVASHRNRNDRIVIVAFVAAVLLLGAAGRFVLRRVRAA